MIFSPSSALRALAVALSFSATEIGVNAASRSSISSRRSLEESKSSWLFSRSTPSVEIASDGSTILQGVAKINGLDIGFKVSAPAECFTIGTNIQGSAAIRHTKGKLGLNVLLHGDGGESFYQFPNQGVRKDLAGVALLAPGEGANWGGGNSNERPTGERDAAAIKEFILSYLPEILAFDNEKVYFTGISGGSKLLTGFFIPAYMHLFPNTGALLLCGAMPPQVPFVKPENFIGNTRLHFQSTQKELPSPSKLRECLTETIHIYFTEAGAYNVQPDVLAKLQTSNNKPDSKHCVFDGQSFNSGVKLLVDHFPNIMQAGGDGWVPGIGVVTDSYPNGIVTFDTDDE
ncbi:uncharacterized protein BROUX77_003901 [Berkeleyomyces rouxiae]|uniref:uncharacterized protein n=1 Tax=Berkeleyomyces rouxiae TaxID=2035830 RepID=UPI003B7A7822